MKTAEKKALLHMLHSISHPSVTASVYSMSTDKLTVTTITAPQEADRLIRSPDYRAGWEACRERVDEIVKFVLSASHSDLKKYGGE